MVAPLAAVVDTCADVGAAVPSGHRDLVLPAGSDDVMLLSLLDEVIFTIDAGEGMPVAADVSRTDGGDLAVRLLLADRASVTATGSVPKAVSRSGLMVDAGPDGVRGTVLVDV